MSYNVYPEYEFFTGVEIKLSVDGDTSKMFIISKIGEHLQSLTIKEGTVSGNNQLVIPDIGGGIASGSVKLYDEDNALFLSLLASKTPEGQQLLNRMDITIKTYTGARTYVNCRISKWSCDFNGGVPTINLEWQSLGGTASPSFSDPTKQAFDPVKAKRLLVDEGVSSFGEFMDALKEIFNNTINFKYTTYKVVNQNSLVQIPNDGRITFFSGDTRIEGTIVIPNAFKPEVYNNRYRMKLNIDGESTSFLSNVMNEICNVARVESNGDVQNIQWKFLYGDTIFIYTYKELGSLSIPQPEGTSDILENTIFLYNSSFPQGQIYNTPNGNKRAFTIDSISTSFDFGQVLIANLSDQNNASCPNGNMVFTSRGAVTIPQSVPEEVAKTIKKIQNLNLSQNFTVRMTVYNFIHFYVMGETPVYLTVFDHLGNVHPMTGRMRVSGYQYEIGEGGVIKADVTLAPLFSETSSAFNSDTPYTIGRVSDTGTTNIDPLLQSQDNRGKADIKIDSSLDYHPIVTPDMLPNFLGIQVKAIPGAKYQQGKDKFKKKPQWIVVHYTASKKANAKAETKAFAKTNRVVSTHFFCDDEDVYQVVSEEYPAWHCGNGKTLQPDKSNPVSNDNICDRATDPNQKDSICYSKSKGWRFDLAATNHKNWASKQGSFAETGDFIRNNLDSFGVDLCSSKLGTDPRKDVDATDWYVSDKTIDNCAKTVAYLCYKWDIDITHVIRHADCTGKPCLPIDKTEVLTPSGFKPLSLFNVGDSVCQYNPSTNSIENTKAISVVEPYVSMVCKNKDYEATLNHRTLAQDITGAVDTKPFIDWLGHTCVLFTYDTCTKEIKSDYHLSPSSFIFYDSLVSCVEVESSYIIIKQNDTIFITGNCPRPFVSLKSDINPDGSYNFDNEKKWKLLKGRTPSVTDVYSYTNKSELDLEEYIDNAEGRTSFLGKVQFYIEVLTKQNYPKPRPSFK